MKLFRKKVREPVTGLPAVPLAFNCPASWDRMRGSDQVRHCSHCNRKVYNLSEMTRFEAKALVMREERHLCVRYYLRPDGNIMTKDCGRAVRMRIRVTTALASAFGIFVGFPMLAPTQGAVKSPRMNAKMKLRREQLIRDEQAAEKEEQLEEKAERRDSGQPGR